MTMRVDFNFQASATESPTVGVPDVATPQIRHDSFNRAFSKKNTDATSPVSINSSQSLTGTQTIDLTALATVNGVVSAAGKQLRALRVSNPSTNTGKLTIGPGAANPYPLFGTTMTLDVQLDGEVEIWFGAGLAAVGATVKTILITPNNVADTYKIQLILG